MHLARGPILTAHSSVREPARMIAPLRNRWIRIQCVTLVMLTMSQVDRANIALAFPDWVTGEFARK